MALGAVLLTISFVRSEQKPILPSIMLAYGLFLPLSAGGVGFGLGATSIWPDGVLVFLVHLALAILVGCITLAVLRFKPSKAGGYLLPFLLGLLCLAALVYFTGLTKFIRDGIIATRRAAPTPTATLVPPSRTPTLTLTPSAVLHAHAEQHTAAFSHSGTHSCLCRHHIFLRRGSTCSLRAGRWDGAYRPVERYHRSGAAGNPDRGRHQLGARRFGTISMAGF